MTLDEAILHLRGELANPAHDWGCEECRAEHEQLLVWLEDYKQIKVDYIDIDKQLRKANTKNAELKRLLSEAIDFIYFVHEQKKANKDCMVTFCVASKISVSTKAKLEDVSFGFCEHCKYYGKICESNEVDFKWLHHDEAMKLIGGDENGL